MSDKYDNLYFVRHTGFGHSVADDLKRDGVIGICYDDERGLRGLDPSNYEGRDRAAVERFLRLGETGGFVIASYDGSLVLGRANGPVAVKDYSGFSMKLLNFNKIVDISLQDAPLLYALLPRQATFTESYLVGEIFKAVNGGGPSTWGWLGATGLEVLCSEWLRSTRRVDHFLTPIGRTLKDVDIVGIKDERMVLAQVTGSPRKSSAFKVETLQSHKDPNSDLYFFCDFPPDDYESFSDGVHWKAIAEVFSEIKTISPRLLEELLKPAEVLRVPSSFPN